jgi:hypothetical protein
MAWYDFLTGSGSTEPEAPEDPQNSWVARLTGDTSPETQWGTFGQGLSNAGLMVALANSRGERNLGNLLAYGTAGFNKSLGAQALLRQQAAVAQAKQRMADLQAQQLEEENAAWGQLPGMYQNGQLDPRAATLRGAAGQRAATLMGQAQDKEQYLAEMEFKMKQLGLDERFRNAQLGLARARLAAEEQQAGMPKWQVDVERGIRYNPATGEVQPLTTTGTDGATTPYVPTTTPKQPSIDDIKIAGAQAATIPPDQRTPEQERLVSTARALGAKIPTNGTSASTSRYNMTTLQDIARAKELAQDYTIIPNTGIGSWLSIIPGTNAADLDKTLESIRANVGFDRMQQMRAESPTGGALGQVSDRENKLLQSVLGSLEQSLSEGQFMANLNRLENTYLDIVHGENNWWRDPNTGQILVGRGLKQSRGREASGGNIRRFNPSTGGFE